MEDTVVHTADEQVSHHAVGDIQERVDEKREVFVLVGLPGAGKSTAAEFITEYIEKEYRENSQHFEVSDFVRALYESEHEEGTNDNDLGAWAAELKAEHGNDYFVRQMTEAIKSPLTPHIVISGVRSPAEATAVREVFGRDSVTVLTIWTLPDKRFERKYSVADYDSEEFETFCERNERELHEWGAIEFFTQNGLQDYIVSNNSSTHGLEADINAIVDHVVGGEDFPPAWQRDWYPFPGNLSTDTIAKYC